MREPTRKNGVSIFDWLIVSYGLMLMICECDSGMRLGHTALLVQALSDSQLYTTQRFRHVK